jgi:cytochrome c oxidase subunit 2
MLVITAFVVIGIYLAVMIFAIKYRRSKTPGLPRPIHGSLLLETAWSVIPFMISMVMFGWATKIYFGEYSPPANAMEIYVVGKQWMWKVQHPDGQREIDELHVPIGRPIKITLATEDVIHSFFLPAFRLKHDAVPGHYYSMTFTADKPGKYRIFCAEYCGTSHSGMIGWVYAMEPSDYDAWLSGSNAFGSMAQVGESLFSQYGCASCHRQDTGGRCPPLVGVFGTRVPLEDGSSVLADEQYIRESILQPRAKVVAGYQPIMPTFQGKLEEDDLLSLIAYIKSIGARTSGGAAERTGQAVPALPPVGTTGQGTGRNEE